MALFFSARRQVAAHWRTLLPHWRYLAVMGTAGFTAFNALFYAAAHHTTAVNLAAEAYKALKPEILKTWGNK